MLINWFTVGAQVVNFLILVWLMRRYLYRPILAAIDARADQVAAVLADANKKMSNATDQLNLYQQKVKSIDDDRARRETEVDQAMKTQRQAMLQSIEDDSGKARQSQADELRAHQTEFAAQLSQLVEAEVLAVSRQAMTDLAGAGLEHQIVTTFMQRLPMLDAGAGAELCTALRQSPCAATITTSFALAKEDCALLGNAVNVFAGASVSLTFSVLPDNICGIELSCNGRRSAWTMADYLNGLGAQSAALLNDAFPVVRPIVKNTSAAPQTACTAPGNTDAAPMHLEQAAS